MKRALLIGMLMTAGTVVTLNAMRAGLSRLRFPPASVVAAQTGRRVDIERTHLRYFEDGNVLTLDAEPGRDRGGYLIIVYVPAEATWLKEMPEWCRHRRNDVLGEIKRLTARERIRWVEYGETAELPNKVLQADDHLGRFAPSVARR